METSSWIFDTISTNPEHCTLSSHSLCYTLCTVCFMWQLDSTWLDTDLYLAFMCPPAHFAVLIYGIHWSKIPYCSQCAPHTRLKYLPVTSGMPWILGFSILPKNIVACNWNWITTDHSFGGLLFYLLKNLCSSLNYNAFVCHTYPSASVTLCI